MKKIIFLFCSLFVFTSAVAQNSDTSVQVGDEFIINKIENDAFQFIHFPENNIITKKGGITDYNKVVGKKVTITKVVTEDDGTQIATIQLSSHGKFFNSHKYIKVSIKDALAQKELLRS